MPSQLKIDQATLAPAGTAGKSRTDGLAGGQLVTLTNTGTGSTTRFRLLWVPAGDTTAVSSLTQTGPKVWTFSPTAARYGTYRIELIEDEGLATERRERRVFRIRTPNRGLVIPALNETGDPSASLANAGAAAIEAAEDNSNDWPTASLNTVRYAAWWRLLHELVAAVDALPTSFDSDAIANLSVVPGATVTDALDSLAVATGAEDGYVSRNVYTNANAPTFTTPADIPPGDEFDCILDGGGGGGGSGSALVNGVFSNVDGGGSGGGGARRRWRMSRAQFIALLPVVLVLPVAAPGGAGAVSTGAEVAGNVGTQGGDALFQSNGVTQFAAFGGAPGTGATTSTGGTGGGGGGHLSAASSGTGGDPGGGASGTSSVYGGGGAGSNSGTGVNPGGASVWGGGGGCRGARGGSAIGTGGDSVFGGTGGGAGGNATGTGTANTGGAGGGHGGPVAAGGVGSTAGAGNVGTAGAAGDELAAGLGGGGGGAATFAGANSQAGAGGAGGQGGGGGGGGGAAWCSSGTATSGAGGAGGAPQFILIGYR